MGSKLSSHVRQNVIGYLALFFALTGVAYAAGPLKSGDPAGGDLAGTYPDPSIAANAVNSGKVSNDSLTGDDISEATLSGVSPSGAAGGDLTGTYPNPSIASGAVETANFSSTIPAVRATSGQGLSVGSGQLAVLPFEGESYDTGGVNAGLHSLGSLNDRLTAPAAGVYRVSVSVNWLTSDPAGSRTLLLLRGSSAIEQDTQPGAAGILTQHLSTDIKLAAGEFVRAAIEQNSGSTLDYGPNSFTMSWVAPG